MPALLTSMSSPPSRACASANSRSTAASSATSAGVVPTEGSASRRAASAASSTSQVWTSAPASTRASTIARPMPDAPAVTSTRLPSARRSATGPPP